MRRKRTVVTGIFLLFIVFCCSGAMAETYNFGGATGNGEYSGSLAVDNSGNVAFTIAAATGPGSSVQTTQNANTGDGASATQETRAAGDSAFVGSGAANAHGDTASTAAHAFGNAEIDSVQGALAGGSGAAAGQMSEITGQGAAAGSLGVSGSGYEASTTTRITDGGQIDTMQGAAAGSFSYNTAEPTRTDSFFSGINGPGEIFGKPLIINIDASGAVAGQISEIQADNGGWASSQASGNGNAAMTRASITGAGSIDTMQVAGAGQIGIDGLLDGISADGAVSGQDSLIESDNGGSASTSVSGANGYQAETAGEFSGNGMYGTTQIAGAGQICINGMGLVDGAVAGQNSLIESDNGGSASSSVTGGNGYQAETNGQFSGNGMYGTTQLAGAGQIGIEGLMDGISAEGAVAGQNSLIESDSGGSASSSVTGGNGYQAETNGQFSGNGMYGTTQVAGAGQIGIDGLLDGISADGAVAGQNSLIESDNGGSASSSVTGGNGYQAETNGQFSGNGMYGTTQVAGAGQIGIDGLLDGISAGGAVAGQNSLIYADNGGYVQSSTTNANGYEAITNAQYSGNGYLMTLQGAAAADIEIPGTASVDGVVAGQYSNIYSDGEASADTYAGTSDLATQAETFAGYSGTGGGLMAVQGAAAGLIDIPGFASVDGAVAGQYAEISPCGTGQAIAGTAAQTGNGYDQVVVVTHSTNGNPIDDVIQGAAAGRISVTDAFNAEGAAAFQHSSSPAGNSMFAGAWHGTTTDYDNTNSPGTQYALAGIFTNGVTIEGADAWH